jgi:hypothetical protein
VTWEEVGHFMRSHAQPVGRLHPLVAGDGLSLLGPICMNATKFYSHYMGCLDVS